jgi:hypothetical protein
MIRYISLSDSENGGDIATCNVDAYYYKPNSRRAAVLLR